MKLRLPKKYFFFLIFCLGFLFSPKSSLAASPLGVNVTDHISEWDKAAEVVGPGGWITIMPKIGNAKDIQAFLDKNPQTNVVIRTHYPDTVPDQNWAASWTATLGNLNTGGRKIYIMPWNEPNMERETGGVGNTLDPNDTAAVPMLKAYTQTLVDYLTAAGLLHTKVGLLSPMINQSAPNYTAFMKALGKDYFKQFDGISMNLYNYSQGCPQDNPLCSANPLLNAGKYREVLKMFGLENIKVFGLEAGIVDRSGTCPAAVTDCPIFEAQAMFSYLQAMYQIIKNDPNFMMLSPLSYNPEISNKNPWIWGSIVEQFMKEMNKNGQLMTGNFDAQTFKAWLEEKIKNGQLEICNEIGYATNLDICQAVPIIPYSMLQPAGEKLICTNPGAQEGPFRPQPCVDCGRPVEEPTLSCSQSFTVSQMTWADVGYGGSNNGEMFTCPGGSIDGDFGFKRDWGGQVVVDTKDTTLPFVNYREKQTDQESKYLAAYFTGTVNRYGPECDLKDAACVTKIFNESGVMSKLLPQKKQDELRCDMLKKVSQGKEFDYEVTEGKQKFKVSDFYNIPSNNILEITSLHAAACAEPKPTGIDPSSDQFAEYLRQHQIWEQRKKEEWDGTIYAQLWPYIPMVTYKDAPGVLSLISQGPPGYFTENNFALSFPHLATLYEASNIVQQALAPYYGESTLTSNASEPILLASANTVDDILKEKIYETTSACAAPQVLGQSTQLAQNTQTNTSKSYLTISIEPEKVDLKNKLVYYGVRIFQNGPKRGHQMLNGQDIGPGEHGEYGYYLSSQDPNWSGVLPPATINSDGSFTVPDIHTWNHILSDENSPWFATRDMTDNCSGSVDMATGQISSTTCVPKKAGQEIPEIKCGNPDNINPGSCEDPDAKEDEDKNPEDAVCSNPYPIVANLEVQDYSQVLSADTLKSLQDEASKCRKFCENCALYDHDCDKCDPPCNWQINPEPLSRTIGVDLNLPYLERIGQLTISNFYRYESDKSQKGEFVPNAYTQYIPGIFDYFRPASMKNFPLWEAKSDINYSYSGGRSNSGVSSPKSEASLISATQNSSVDQGEIYYPWLGGVQWAKKCIAESALVPEEMAKSEYCPEMGTDTRGATTDNPPLAPTLDVNSEFYQQEKKIEAGQKQNKVLELPEQIKKVENSDQLADILSKAGYQQYLIDRILANIPAYQQAEKQTGIPWQVYAAINGVETNFRADNPGNSDGPMQVTGSNYQANKTNTYEEFVDILVDAGSIIKIKVETARKLGFIDSQKPYSQFNQTDWAQVAYLYNGMPAEKTGPDGKTYYGKTKDSWQKSGYVANSWNGNSSMYVSDGKGGMVNIANNKGFLANFIALNKLGL